MTPTKEPHPLMPSSLTDVIRQHTPTPASLLAVAVCAVLAGACTFAAITDWADDPAAGRRLGPPAASRR